MINYLIVGVHNKSHIIVFRVGWVWYKYLYMHYLQHYFYNKGDIFLQRDLPILAMCFLFEFFPTTLIYGGLNP